MPYKHTEDIDPDFEFDCQELDKRLNVLCLRTEQAVGRSPYGPARHNLLAQYVSLFAQTHRSIRALGRTTFEHDGQTGDAMSLAREQIEKVFAMALFVEDYEKWSQRLFIDGWMKAYEAFLREAQEYGGLPRLAPYYTQEGPVYLETLRQLSKAPPELKEYLDLSAACKNTSHVNAYKPAKYRFPTPSKVMGEIQVPERKACLEKWYAEYETYCSFSHVLAQKIVLGTVQQKSRISEIEQRVKFLSKSIEPALLISYTATTYALTDLNTLLAYDLDVLEAAEGLWSILQQASLLGRSVWDIHGKTLMLGGGLDVQGTSPPVT